MRTVQMINRRPHSGQFSIENIFSLVGSRLADKGWSISQYISPRLSEGLWPRLYNLIHIFLFQKGVTHIVGDVTYLALLIRRRTLVITIHDIGLYQNKPRGICKYLVGLFWYRIPLARARGVTTISEFTRQALVREFGAERNHIHVIPNPVSAGFHFIEQRPIDATARIDLLHIGTKPNKNLSRTIEALELLASKYCLRLTVIGQMTPEQTNHPSKNLEIVNHKNLTSAEVIEQYQQCHIVVFPSLYEGFGMPIIEAQAIGRPVITSNIEPMRTVAGGAAKLIDPLSSGGLASAIEEVISDPEEAARLVELGKENAAMYSIEFVAERYAQLYLETSP